MTNPAQILADRLSSATVADNPFSDSPVNDLIGAEVAEFLKASGALVAAAESSAEAFSAAAGLVAAVGDSIVAVEAASTGAGSLLALMGLGVADLAAAADAGHTFAEECPACDKIADEIV